ncbi:hypothetical protein KFK09_026440 [Dendrobium nobile]|uniref:Reticulon domain-containing protein n=1 Tax=Dendrobium nobile TaxID=94219 RepID=A0A8T3A857_DENNO|nr:hypothetical protein KFK09_026440 [Dendrobium nobile]
MDEVAAVSKDGLELGRPAVVLLCGSLVYYHCAYRDSSLLSLFSDVLIVLLCSLAILGMLFRQMNISVPVDPLEWQLSQDTSNSLAACLANTIGAAESVLRVAATGHDKRLFLKVFGLCICCIYIFAQNSVIAKFTCKIGRRESTAGAQDSMQTDEASIK